MDEDSLKQFMQQHISNYRNSVLEIVRNNTTVLVDEDITSLFKEPPLDSMDFLKVKILGLAKKNKIIFNTVALNQILSTYRFNVLKCCSKLKKIRIDFFTNKIKKIDLDSKNSIIRINKKDFVTINREFKKVMKEQLAKSFESCVIKKIDSIFPDDVDEKVKDSIVSELTKYFKGTYQRQVLENYDIKIMVKDTILINSTKEQSDHYLFTIKNSRLLNDI